MSDKQDVEEATVKTEEAGEETKVENPTTYTSEDVEAMIKKRLAKFSDYDDLKAENETLREKVKSEEEIATLVSEAVDSATAEVTNKSIERLIKAETKALAAEMGWAYPSDAHLYIDATQVDIKDGEISTDSLKGLLEEVVKERPNLVRSETPVTRTEAGLGVRGNTPKRTTGQMFADALNKSL